MSPIIETSNPLFFILLGVSILLCVFLIRIFGNASRLQKRRLIIIMYAIVSVFLVVYKFNLPGDAEYMAALSDAGLSKENIWDELPLELCNINTLLIVIAALTDSKVLYSFVFYFGSFGALFAIFMPCTGFSGYSILTLRVAGFYITHFLLLILTPLIAGINLFRPKYKDILPAIGVLSVSAAMATGLNFLLRGIGLTDSCNYFFTMEPAGNPVLSLFYSVIPVPGLYLLPCLVIALAWMLLATFVSGFIFRNPRSKQNGDALYAKENKQIW